MYVCMYFIFEYILYVCMNAGKYVCMYVCMYVLMYDYIYVLFVCQG